MPRTKRSQDLMPVRRQSAGAAADCGHAAGQEKWMLLRMRESVVLRHRWLRLRQCATARSCTHMKATPALQILITVLTAVACLSAQSDRVGKVLNDARKALGASTERPIPRTFAAKGTKVVTTQTTQATLSVEILCELPNKFIWAENAGARGMTNRGFNGDRLITNTPEFLPGCFSRFFRAENQLGKHQFLRRLPTCRRLVLSKRRLLTSAVTSELLHRSSRLKSRRRKCSTKFLQTRKRRDPARRGASCSSCLHRQITNGSLSVMSLKSTASPFGTHLI
jgi:hypothetical protein